MGGGDDSKKTLTAAQKLLKDLLENANKLPREGEPIKLQDPPNASDLEKILQAAGKYRFQKDYGYSFDGGSPTSFKPIGNATRTSALCNIDDRKKEKDQINLYVDGTIMSALLLSDWVKASVRGDIVGEADNLVGLNTGNIWSTAKLNKLYNSPHPTDNSVKLDSTFIFVNGHPDESQATTLTIIYYIGVHYTVASPHQRGQEALWEQVCASAKVLAPQVPLPANAKIEQLAAVLKDYGTKLFARPDEGAGFPYAVHPAPPELIGPKGYCQGVEKLCFIEDPDQASLAAYIRAHILSMYTLPDDCADLATKDLQEQILGLRNSDTKNNWESQVMRKLYNPVTASEQKNAIKSFAQFVYCNTKIPIDGEPGKMINYTLVYYVGAYYEIISPFTQVKDDLFEILSENGNQKILNKIPIVKPITYGNLGTIAQAFSEQNFVMDKKIGYHFQGDETKPPNKTPKSKLWSAKAFAAIVSTGDKGSEQFVNHEVLSQMKALPWLKNLIRTDLVGDAQYLGTKHVDNDWQYIVISNVYDNAVKGRDSYAHDAVIGYCNSYLNEQAVSKEVRMTFLSYVGVIYGVPPDEG